MQRALTLSLGLSFMTLVSGCATSHTVGGEPALDDAGVLVAPRFGEPCIPTSASEGGYDAREISIESYTPVCGEPYFEGAPTRPPIGTCVVYGLQGDPRPGCAPGTCASPAEVELRTFCSCRCGGAPGTGPFCSCGSGYRCESLLDARSGRFTGGSYCVPDALPVLR